MLRLAARSFGGSESGAISPLYAVAILMLVVMAGVGFDYGRVMALDTELQNAADQAALAAATQLDGSAEAITNAETAAANALGNETRFANDGTRAIPTSGLTFVYYEDYVNDAPVNETTVPEDARVVQVTVEDRAVRYALTPVMATFSGGVARGRAMAMLQAATCNVPPMMFCQPYNEDGDVDTSFPTAADIGRGLKLHFKTNGKDSPGNPNEETTDDTIWAPGNFGFLDLEYLPKSGQNSTTGLNSDPFGCTGEAPISNPGFRTPQGSALNSRLDLYPPPKKSCETNGDFCPSTNARKNLVLKMNKGAKNCNNPPNNPNSNDWVAPDSVGIPDPGYPQDTNFVADSSAVIGNANWGAGTWLNSHHGVTSSDIPDANGDGNISRYEVYLWEMAASSRLNPTFFTGSDGNNYCSFPRPIDEPPGLAPGPDQKDRRLLTIAAVDCTGLNGKAPVSIKRWVDVFIVQPVSTTGSERWFFTEIVGSAKQPNGESGFQYYGRRKAVLLR